MTYASSRFESENESSIEFYFICEGCRSEGQLVLEKKDGMKPFGCPEGCGATYVPWKYEGKWKLQCVVCPVFVEER